MQVWDAVQCGIADRGIRRDGITFLRVDVTLP